MRLGNHLDGLVAPQVVDSGFQKGNAVTKTADPVVATVTEKGSMGSSPMIVVNVQNAGFGGLSGWGEMTDGTQPVLGGEEGLVFLRGDAVVSLGDAEFLDFPIAGSVVPFLGFCDGAGFAAIVPWALIAEISNGLDLLAKRADLFIDGYFRRAFASAFDVSLKLANRNICSAVVAGDDLPRPELGWPLRALRAVAKHFRRSEFFLAPPAFSYDFRPAVDGLGFLGAMRLMLDTVIPSEWLTAVSAWAKKPCPWSGLFGLRPDGNFWLSEHRISIRDNQVVVNTL